MIVPIQQYCKQYFANYNTVRYLNITVHLHVVKTKEINRSERMSFFRKATSIMTYKQYIKV
jgi:hypothetical protein